MDFPFLKKETFGLRTQETFVGNKCEIFIPLSFIGDYTDKKTITVELGDHVETIGLFWFCIDGKEWYELQLPVKFKFAFSSKYKKKFKLRPELPEDEYMVYVLNKGDAFMYDILYKKNLDDLTTNFIDKMIEKANLPSYISYSDSLGVFLKAMKATEFTNIGVSSVSLEFMLSELYRNKKNMRQPFRMIYNGRNPYAYKMVRITKVPEMNSSFTGLIGEDIQNQLIAAVLRTREGAPDRASPVEKVIKF